MSGADRMRNAAAEAVGRATDTARLQAEGKADHVKANLTQAGGKVKDAFKD